MGNLITTEDLAHRLSLKPNSVTKAARAGRFGTAAHRNAQGGWLFDWPQARDEYDARTDTTRVSGERQGAAPAEAGLRAAVERKNHYEAELKLVKLRETAGELVDAAAVKKKQTETYAHVRSRLLGIPTSLKQMAPETPVSTVQIVERLVFDALKELST